MKKLLSIIAVFALFALNVNAQDAAATSTSKKACSKTCKKACSKKKATSVATTGEMKVSNAAMENGSYCSKTTASNFEANGFETSVCDKSGMVHATKVCAKSGKKTAYEACTKSGHVKMVTTDKEGNVISTETTTIAELQEGESVTKEAKTSGTAAMPDAAPAKKSCAKSCKKTCSKKAKAQ